MFKGLKIENNCVLKKNETTENWEKLTPSSIPLLEELLKKIDSVSYSKEDRRENFVFENKMSIVQESIKSSRDENGDIVFTIGNRDNNENRFKINEDLDFDIEEQNIQTNRDERKLVNYWSNTGDISLLKCENDNKKSVNSKNKESEGIVLEKSHSKVSNSNKKILAAVAENTSLKNCELNNLKQISVSNFENEDELDVFAKISKLKLDKDTTLKITKHSPVDLKIAKEKHLESLKNSQNTEVTLIKPRKPDVLPLDYTFKKRLKKSISLSKVKTFHLFLRELNRINGKNCSNIAPKPLKSICFIRRVSWNAKRRKHGSIIKANEIAKRLNGVKDLYSCMFQLEKVPNVPMDDLDFDKIIKDTLNSNVQ